MLFMVLSSLTGHTNTWTVTSKVDGGAGSLRQTIINASANDTILFSNTLNNDSIVLIYGELVINKDIVIIGPSSKLLTLSGNKSSRIFFILSGKKLILQSLSLRGGYTLNIHGGAIQNNGTLIIKQCYFYENHCKNSGGAIFNAGKLEIEESTFAFNRADSNGGAIATEYGTATITSSTFSNNKAGVHAGAYFQRSVDDFVPKTTFSCCTITENSAVQKGGGVCNIFYNYLDTTIITFDNTIIAKNTSSINWGHDIARGLSSRCYINSDGNNLVGNSDSSGFQGFTGDVIGNSKSPIDPRLSALADNGGQTKTHALGCGSPALDFGNPFLTLTTDQRGYNRKYNGVADIGAYEAQTDMYIPLVDLGKNIDTCIGINLVLTAGRPTDSVNWIKPNKTAYLIDNHTLNFKTSFIDSIIAEVISPAGCAGYDTIRVKLKDTKNPIFSNCPSDIKVYSPWNSCNKTVSWTPPVATDECGLDTVFSNYEPGDTFMAGSATVIYTAVDYAGNKAVCSFKISVTDTLKPTISKLSNINGIAESGKCGSIVTYLPPVGSDNCAGAVTKQIKGLGTGAFFPVGKTEEIYIVTDASGNTDTSRFFINIIDIEDPILTPPANINKNTDSGKCSALIFFNFPVATDNCPDPKLTVISGFKSGTDYPKGKTDVLFRLSDSSGNSDTAAFWVDVSDSELPVVQCPSNIESCDTIVNYSLPVFNDNCPGATLNLLSGLGSNKDFPYGESVETYQVIDASGNKNSCSFKVNVHPAPNLDIGADTFIYQGEQIQLKPKVNDIVDYVWTPNTFIDDPISPTPFVFPESKTVYHLLVTNKYNCSANDSIIVDVKFEIFVPTLFTPGNADGKGTNDTWEIKGLKNKPDWEVRVFDLWGHEVYYSKGYDEAWNGEYRGKPLPPGTYLFIIDNLIDNVEAIKGELTIIR